MDQLKWKEHVEIVVIATVESSRDSGCSGRMAAVLEDTNGNRSHGAAAFRGAQCRHSPNNRLGVDILAVLVAVAVAVVVVEAVVAVVVAITV